MPSQTRHRRWALFFLIVSILAGIAYAYEVRQERAKLFGPSGGGAIGLGFGAAALASILFGASRGLRRWMPAALGSAGTWASAHVWLGALALPLAWFHGGFRHGGPLTNVMMWVLYGMIASGAVAAILRYYLSHPTTGGLPEEWLDLPPDQAQTRLSEDAEKTMGRISMFEEEESGGSAAVAVATTTVLKTQPLKDLYQGTVAPYFLPAGARSILSHRMRAARIFGRCRALIPDAAHATLAELERLCDLCRRLRSRQRLARWVDVAMLVHVPLATALVVLAAFHSVFSLRY